MTSLIKKSAIFFLAIILAFILIMISIEIVAQLKKDQMEDLETDSNNDVIKIGLSLGTLKEERWIKDSELLQAKAAEYGVEVIVLNANNDDQDQLNQVEYLIKQDIDVRGMRGDEALQAVTYFIDDAILVGMDRVRILHGTGTGILRTLIRQYLQTVPGISHFADEHIQFGGAGITVVDLS